MDAARTSSATLPVAETFYSIQGEGRSLGIPAVFLRLGGCNLRCPGFSYVDSKTGAHWGCDTLGVWKKAHRMTVSEIIAHWQHMHWLGHFARGAHLVITGGEPCLHQTTLTTLCKRLQDMVSPSIFIECETNATQPLQHQFIACLSQINASPKLRLSAEPRKKRYIPAVLQQLAALPDVDFKFVVNCVTDIDEIYADFIQAFQLSHQQIWLMPEGGSQATLHGKYRSVVAWCLAHGFNFTPRIHIDIWDQATGV